MEEEPESLRKEKCFRSWKWSNLMNSRRKTLENRRKKTDGKKRCRWLKREVIQMHLVSRFPGKIFMNLRNPEGNGFSSLSRDRQLLVSNLVNRTVWDCRCAQWQISVLGRREKFTNERQAKFWIVPHKRRSRRWPVVMFSFKFKVTSEGVLFYKTLFTLNTGLLYSYESVKQIDSSTDYFFPGSS